MSSEPVILKMSCNESPASGKGELWIIGQLHFQISILNLKFDLEHRSNLFQENTFDTSRSFSKKCQTGTQKILGKLRQTYKNNF